MRFLVTSAALALAVATPTFAETDYELRVKLSGALTRAGAICKDSRFSDTARIEFKFIADYSGLPPAVLKSRFDDGVRAFGRVVAREGVARACENANQSYQQETDLLRELLDALQATPSARHYPRHSSCIMLPGFDAADPAIMDCDQY